MGQESSPNSEDGIDEVQLISFEVELFSHPTDVCIIQICAIKIICKVHQTTKCQDEEIYHFDQSGSSVFGEG